MRTEGGGRSLDGLQLDQRRGDRNRDCTDLHATAGAFTAAWQARNLKDSDRLMPMMGRLAHCLADDY